MTTITITQQQWDTFDNALAAVERDIRKLRREWRDLKPKPSAATVPEIKKDDSVQVAEIWQTMYAAYRIPANPDVPTVTRLENDTLTVFVEAQHLKWFKDHSFNLQKMLCDRLPDPVTLVFEADPHEATSDTTPPAGAETPGPGESDDQAPDTGVDDPMPEPAPALDKSTMQQALIDAGFPPAQFQVCQNSLEVQVWVTTAYQEQLLKLPGYSAKQTGAAKGRIKFNVQRKADAQKAADAAMGALTSAGVKLLTAQAGGEA